MISVALYRRLLGARFDALPARVRELHDVTETAVWAGRADVERGKSWASRLVAALFRLPPDGRQLPLEVSFEPVGGREIWTRSFGTSVFRSVQREQGGQLFECVGPVCLVSDPVASAEGLALDLVGVRLLGVPIPRAILSRVRTLESERDGRYRFEAEAHLPVVGLLVRYAGWLERGGAPSA